MSAEQVTPAGSGEPRSPRSVIAVFTSHWLAMVGLALVLTAIVLWSCLLTMRLRQGEDNPYIGLATLAVAGVLVLGATLAPIGLFLGRRRLREKLLVVDRKAAWGRLIAFLLVTSLVNVVIVSQSAVRVVHAMETKTFCGSCHVMTPESRAISQGPHAGILCVDCHVGEGTVGYIESKIQGTHQLIAVLTDTVPKPIKGAIEAGKMIPSAETCEGCHWKAQPAKAKVKMFRHYGEDEKNSPETTVLTMYVGGARMGGIHGAHHGEGVRIQFVATDGKRQDIPWVEYTDSTSGERRTYVRKGADPASFASLPRITMQCFDCHNRPAHSFEMPDRAVDQALVLGRMSVGLPFLKKTSVEILEAEYASNEAAAAEIPQRLAAYYATDHAELASTRAADIDEAGQVLADIYSRNVFPDLGVTWGTYPDNRGHQSFPGCFRCHGGEHADAAGTVITRSCFRCHYPSATAEAEPKVLETLGVDRTLQDLDKK
jgi:nitrate/TMAO reductase-like tetraheme cytochrome c subunit